MSKLKGINVHRLFNTNSKHNPFLNLLTASERQFCSSRTWPLPPRCFSVSSDDKAVELLKFKSIFGPGNANECLLLFFEGTSSGAIVAASAAAQTGTSDRSMSETNR